MPSYFLALNLLSTIVGIVWCYFLIEILVDILDCYVQILNFNNTFIGITILGIGNALPDAFTTFALAK